MGNPSRVYMTAALAHLKHGVPFAPICPDSMQLKVKSQELALLLSVWIAMLVVLQRRTTFSILESTIGCHYSPQSLSSAAIRIQHKSVRG